MQAATNLAFDTRFGGTLCMQMKLDYESLVNLTTDALQSSRALMWIGAKRLADVPSFYELILFCDKK